jgi:hypothetical protein
MLQRTFLIIPSPYHIEHSHCMGPCLFLLHRGHSGSPSCNPAAVHQGKSHKGFPEGPPDIGRGVLWGLGRANKCNQANWGFVQLRGLGRANKCNQANWGFVQLSSYIHTCMHACIHIYIQTDRQTLHTYIHKFIHTDIHTYIQTYMHTYIHTHIHTYIPTYLHTYTHSNIHTYIT